jgi:hypothetical protein
MVERKEVLKAGHWDKDLVDLKDNWSVDDSVAGLAGYSDMLKAAWMACNLAAV